MRLLQGYNAQAVCNKRHLIVAAEVMTASPDFGHLGPMLAAARRELANAGVTKPPDVVVADAGYWHLEQMNEITGDGIPVLIPPDSSRRANKPKRPDRDAPGFNSSRPAAARVEDPLRDSLTRREHSCHECAEHATARL